MNNKTKARLVQGHYEKLAKRPRHEQRQLRNAEARFVRAALKAWFRQTQNCEL